MNRRRLLLAGGGAAALAAGTAWYAWPEQGLFNPCLEGLPPELAGEDCVRAAWEGLDPARVWDCHVHLIGIGEAPGGTWINPRMTSLAHPVEYAQRLFFLDAGCAEGSPGTVGARYVERMARLAAGFAPGAKLLLLAFDHTYDDQARRDPARSAFHTANEYAREVAARHPERFEWAASIHPYRADCVEALEWAARHGARAVKWLPPAMGIDPASPRCDTFYAAAARLGIPILTHAGEEKAVHGAGAHTLGNPLKLRRALEHGVRVIVAHCASIGSDIDLDRGPNGPVVPSIDLFARLLDEPRHAGRLYGDVSAIVQINRSIDTVRRLVERGDWHARLLNGSDYPLPGVLPLISVGRLVAAGMLDAHTGEVLKRIRAHNPLLFDFVLKRSLRSNGARFAAEVFHTRDRLLAR